MFEKVFKLKERNTTLKTEIMAGITSFMAIAYILVVNPQILSEAGMDMGAVFTATILASIISLLIMAFYANLPFVLAPGMGLNAYFTYTVVNKMGYTYQQALAAVFIEGIIFLLLTVFNVREKIIDGLPKAVKAGMGAGIGFFIAFIGLRSTGVIVSDPDTLVGLGNLKDPVVLLVLLGIIIIGVLLTRKVKGAMLYGMITVTVIGVLIGAVGIPDGMLSLPPSMKGTFLSFLDGNIFTFKILEVVFIFLFVDMFDTIGTLVSVSEKAGLVDENGNVINGKQAMIADSVGSITAGAFGSSAVTTYVESATGVAEGGRTGLVPLVAAALFALALFFSPILTWIPSFATAPVLILVGAFMMTSLLNIKMSDYSEAIPAFLTIIVMIFSTIADGIGFGIISYLLIKLLSGRYKEIKLTTLFVALIFIIKYALF